jgi:ATP-dependent Clp protease, protease subunit
MSAAPIIELPTTNSITYYGYTGLIDSASVTKLCQALNVAVIANTRSIYLCLSSPGGYVADGIYLYNHIRALPVEVTIHATGTIASIATAAFVAGAKRYSSANAMFMMHPTSVGPFPQGVAAETLQSALNSAVADDERTERILRDRTNLTDDVLRKRRISDVHLSPQEAFEFGLIHEIREFTVPPGNQLIQL